MSPSEARVTVDSHQHHLSYVRRYHEPAAEAVARGNHPFGAMLVLDRRVVAEARKRDRG